MTVLCLAQPGFWAAAQAPRASLLGDSRGWEPANGLCALLCLG